MTAFLILLLFSSTGWTLFKPCWQLGINAHLGMCRAGRGVVDFRILRDMSLHLPMATLKLLTWNVRGIRDPVKRSAVFSLLKKQRADVVVLVETHTEGPMHRALTHPWIGWVFHSVHTSHSRRVSISIARTTHFELQGSEIDPMGRYVLLKAKLLGDLILILAFYVRPPFNSTVLVAGFDFMALYPNIPAIWLGDFNNVLDPALDRMSRSAPLPVSPHPTRFARLLTDFNLADTWRARNPTSRAYSCFSTSHHSMSSIDLILVSKTLLPRLTDIGFSPRSLPLLDHTPSST